MADYITARNDRERLAAVRRHLLRAIDLFPGQQLPDQKRRRAVDLANKATSTPDASSSQAAASRGFGPNRNTQESSALHLSQRLKARGEAVRAHVELLKLLVPALRTWERQTRTRQETFLEQEDELSEQQLERQLAGLAAFAEAARALDACFMALRGRINIPYRHALLTAHDAFMDEEVPELMALVRLEEGVAWGTPGNTPFLGNPLEGPMPYPDDLLFDTGAPASLDFQLLGLVWAESAVQHAVAALAASNADRNSFAQSMGRGMIPKLEKQACDLLLPCYLGHAGLEVPEVQRGAWTVLGSLQQLSAWCGGSLQECCPLLVDLLRRMLAKRGLPALRPELAPTAARDTLAGTSLMPVPPPRSRPPAPAPAEAQPAAQEPLATRTTSASQQEPQQATEQPQDVATPVQSAAPAPATAGPRASAAGATADDAPTTTAAATAPPPALSAQPAAPRPAPGAPCAPEVAALSPQGPATANAEATLSAGTTASTSGLPAPEATAIQTEAAGVSVSGAAGWAGGLGAMRGLLAQAASAVSAALAPRRPSTATAVTTAATAVSTEQPATDVGAAAAGMGGSAVAGFDIAREDASVAAGCVTAAAPSPSAAAADAGEGADGSDTDDDEGDGAAEGAVGAAAAAGGAGAAAAAKRKKKKKKRSKRKGAAPQGPQPNGALATAGVAATAAAPADPAAELAAAVAAEQPDCCVCLEELTASSVALMSCVVRSAEGPFHALCNACWAGLSHPRCPICCAEDVEGLSLREFLQRLQQRGP